MNSWSSTTPTKGPMTPIPAEASSDGRQRPQTTSSPPPRQRRRHRHRQRRRARRRSANVHPSALPKLPHGRKPIGRRPAAPTIPDSVPTTSDGRALPSPDAPPGPPDRPDCRSGRPPATRARQPDQQRHRPPPAAQAKHQRRAPRHMVREDQPAGPAPSWPHRSALRSDRRAVQPPNVVAGSFANA